MRSTLRPVVWLAGLLASAALTPAAQAQIGPRPGPGRLPAYFSRPAVVNVPTYIGIRVQTTVTVPDRGTALLGGYSRLSEGRVSYGAPGLGRLPYAGRGFRNVAYGRSAVSARVSASVRIIDLREEEYRQTGVRSR